MWGYIVVQNPHSWIRSQSSNHRPITYVRWIYREVLLYPQQWEHYTDIQALQENRQDQALIFNSPSCASIRHTVSSEILLRDFRGDCNEFWSSNFSPVANDWRPILFQSQTPPGSRQNFSVPKVVDILDADKSRYFCRNQTRTFKKDFEKKTLFLTENSLLYLCDIQYSTTQIQYSVTQIQYSTTQNNTLQHKYNRVKHK